MKSYLSFRSMDGRVIKIVRHNPTELDWRPDSHLNLIFTFLLSLGRTSAVGLLVLEGIIHPVVSVSALTWFIIYICFRNFQSLSHVIIKTKVFFPQS